MHACSSCVKTVVQTFTYYHEQIAQLKKEKEKLQEELRKLIEDKEKQKRVFLEKISVLEKKVAFLKKNSETPL